MSDIGAKITQLRKKKNLSQMEFAKAIGASRTMVGNYERNVNSPSIEMIAKIAKVLEVSIDYLVGNSAEKIDKVTLNRVLEINKLQPKDKEMVFSFLDAFLMRNKLQNIL